MEGTLQILFRDVYFDNDKNSLLSNRCDIWLLENLVGLKGYVGADSAFQS
jgi:hypothetical protein